MTELPLDELSQMVGRQLPLFSLLVPFWLVCSMVGWREMLRVWPACLTAGASFGLVQFAVSNWHGPWLVDIAGSVASIVALVGLLNFWTPPAIDEQLLSHIAETSNAANAKESSPTAAATSSTMRALLPWIILVMMVSLWGIPLFNKTLERTTPKFAIPGLHLQVQRVPPVVEKPTDEKAEFELKVAVGYGDCAVDHRYRIGLCLGLGPLTLMNIFLKTLQRTATSLATIAAMLALGFTTRYSGLDATMGLAMASTGWMFPFFSPLLGWLGVALTGSDTASNVLFGNLQKITAERVGISPVLAAAANSSGGVMGKMIDAQSIVVAGVATGQHGQEGKILRYVFFHSLALAVLVGLLVATQAAFDR